MRTYGENPVSIVEWLLLMLLFIVPGINIVAVLVFALGFGKPSLVNFCRALLVWFAITLVFAGFLGLFSL